MAEKHVRAGRPWRGSVASGTPDVGPASQHGVSGLAHGPKAAASGRSWRGAAKATLGSGGGIARPSALPRISEKLGAKR